MRLPCEVSDQGIEKKPDSPQKIDVNQDTVPLYPSGAVPLGSPFYVERAHLEVQIDREIRKSGALVRIKAPTILRTVLDRQR